MAASMFTAIRISRPAHISSVWCDWRDWINASGCRPSDPPVPISTASDSRFFGDSSIRPCPGIRLKLRPECSLLGFTLLSSRPQAHANDAQNGFSNNAPFHLCSPQTTLGKDDRDLHNPEIILISLVGHLDLKQIASGKNFFEINCLQRFTPPALEPARRIRQRHPRNEPRG